MRLLKSIGLLGVLTLSGLVYGQDIHYTQVAQTPLLLNPGATGAFDGWERVTLAQKNQWIGAGTRFFTTSLAADMNFFKNKRNSSAHMGIGLLVYNDFGGDTRLGQRQVLLNASGILPLGNGHQVSAGLQFGAGQRGANLQNATFGNQFDGEEFDPDMASYETDNLNSFFYPDVSAGVYYRFDGGRNNLDRFENFRAEAGAAYFHVNKPAMKFRTAADESIMPKMVFHGKVSKDLEGSYLGVVGNLAHTRQGPHNETIVGLMLKYRFKEGTKMTGLRQDAYIGFQVYHRVKDAVAPGIAFSMSGFDVGVTYDLTISRLGAAKRGGGLEFTLAYSNLDHALFKRRRW